MVAVCSEAKDQPVFLAGTAQGLFLADRACTLNALTSYLQSRALWSGFSIDCSMYSWALASKSRNECPPSHRSRPSATVHVTCLRFEGVWDKLRPRSLRFQYSWCCTRRYWWYLNSFEEWDSWGSSWSELLEDLSDREEIIKAFVDQHENVEAECLF